MTSYYFTHHHQPSSKNLFDIIYKSRVPFGRFWAVEKKKNEWGKKTKTRKIKCLCFSKVTKNKE